MPYAQCDIKYIWRENYTAKIYRAVNELFHLLFFNYSCSMISSPCVARDFKIIKFTGVNTPKLQERRLSDTNTNVYPTRGWNPKHDAHSRFFEVTTTTRLSMQSELKSSLQVNKNALHFRKYNAGFTRNLQWIPSYSPHKHTDVRYYWETVRLPDR